MSLPGSPPAAWRESFWRLLFPPRCLFCRALLPPASVEPLCRRCRPGFQPAGLICPRCLQLCPPCHQCSPFGDPYPLQGLYALSWYQGEWRRMLHRFKFEGKRQLARPLGRWLGELVSMDTGWPLELVTPLPLHRRREEQRGFNQTYLLARYAAQSLGLPLVPLLRKTRDTAAQTGLSRKLRRENVAGAFALTRPDSEGGKGVLLVDDIYSTGATLREAASVLQRRGFTVYGAVVAFNPHRG